MDEALFELPGRVQTGVSEAQTETGPDEDRDCHSWKHLESSAST